LLRKILEQKEEIKTLSQETKKRLSKYLDRTMEIPPSYVDNNLVQELQSFLVGEDQEEIYKKNLEKIKNIPLNRDDKILFFLGAGASIPSPSNIPGVKNLLQSLWDKSENLGKPELDKLREFCNEHNISNIEDILTSSSIAELCSNNSNILQLLGNFLYPEEEDLNLGKYTTKEKETVSSFKDNLNTLFSLLCSTMIQAKPNLIHDSIAKFKTLPKSIITTNYDLCMDTALFDNQEGINYEMVDNLTKKGISLIKIHGSINWFYCNTCQHIKILSIKNMDQIIRKEHIYAVNGVCPECSALTNLLIIPPTSFKYMNYPPLIPLWDKTQEYFKNSKLIIFIGYSFSDSDDYITKMITNALRANPEKYLLILDKNEETINRIKRIIKLHIKGYDQEKFLFSVISDANEKIQEILKSINVS
jgi:NAD-dependent SIR2 family protein deacetylase